MELTTKRVLMCMSYNQEQAWAMHFASKMTLPSDNIFSTESNLTGPFNLCESHDVQWIIQLFANKPINNLFRIPSCPFVLTLDALANASSAGL